MKREERQAYTGYVLRRSIAEHGAKSDEARRAAIEFCLAHNIDPHWRHLLQRELVVTLPDDPPKPLDIDEYSVTQWQQVIAEFGRP